MKNKKQRFKFAANLKAYPRCPETVEGYSLSDHFYAHKYNIKDGWRLSHKASGLAIFGCRTLKMCQQIADELEACGVPWAEWTTPVAPTPDPVRYVLNSYPHERRYARGNQ